jgi:glycogen debranching enzyme
VRIQPEERGSLSARRCADDRTRGLKHGETFAVLDRYGDIHALGPDQQGLHHEDTQFLSRFVLQLGRSRPLLLSSTMKDDNALLTADLTNPDFTSDRQVTVPRGTLHIFPSTFLWQGTCYARMRVYNYGPMPIDIPLFL